jgi:hypothetical protein
MRRECVASVSGPDSSDAVTSDDADQASVAVLSRHVDRKLACGGYRHDNQVVMPWPLPS